MQAQLGNIVKSTAIDPAPMPSIEDELTTTPLMPRVVTGQQLSTPRSWRDLYQNMNSSPCSEDGAAARHHTWAAQVVFVGDRRALAAASELPPRLQQRQVGFRPEDPDRRSCLPCNQLAVVRQRLADLSALAIRSYQRTRFTRQPS
jgi:hypothetical protein